MRYLLILFIVLGSALMNGCNSAVSNLKPFKLEIQQGNVVTSKMLLQLRPGMTKSQVRYIMGTPLIVDSFHSNRWDYIFQLRQAGKITEQKRVVIDFENEQLKAVRGDVMPTAEVGVVKLTPAAEATAPKTKNSKDNTGESFTEKLKFWKDDKPLLPPEANVEVDKVSPEPVAAAKNEVVVPPAAAKDVITTPLPNESVTVPVAIAELLLIPTPPAIGSSVAEPIEQNVVTQPVVESPPSAPASTQQASPPEVEQAAVVQSLQAAPNANSGRLANYELKFDRTLDFKRNNISSEVKASTAPNNNRPIKNNTVEPDSEHGYFERMLEKIGF
ncbi:MAG: outer membrane protein assembly factor BamE [Methylophilaceae bacterium]|nr:outer membrane protein assembly factor BamE [Methylophilaceae bacterium]